MNRRRRRFVTCLQSAMKRFFKDEGVPVVRNYYVLLVIACTASMIMSCVVINSRDKSNEAKRVDTSEVMKQNNTVAVQPKEDNQASDPFDDTDASMEPEATVEPTKAPTPVPSDVKRVYLTFDDGPGKHTGAILDVLKKENVKATFFVIGRKDNASVALYKRIVDEGHTIGVHSYSHDYDKIYSSLDAFSSDFNKLKDYLEEITKTEIKYSRFPGGSSTTTGKKGVIRQCIGYLNKEGIRYYDWNVLNGDATGKKYSEEQLINNVVSGVKQMRSSVVLMHDADAKVNTANSLPKLITKLKELDVEILPIDDDTPLIQHIKSSSIK